MTALGYFFLSNLKVTRCCVWLFVHESLLPSEHPPAVGGTFSTLEAEVPVDEGFFFKYSFGVADLPVGIILLFKGWLVPVPAPT